MQSLALLSFTVTLVTGSSISRITGGNDTEEGSLNPRIVGGVDASDSQLIMANYQVNIKYQNSVLCGGSIISHQFILTAAHCIYGKNPKFMKIVVETEYYVAKTLFWPSTYDETKSIDDIGLIRLDRDIENSNQIQPIKLASTYSVVAGKTALVAGWEKQDERDPSSPFILKQLTVSVISQSQCKMLHPTLAKNNICTHTKDYTGFCYGNSGNPLVLKDEQIGIVSSGAPCGAVYPTVYTRVDPYRSWIAHITNISDLNAGNHIHLNTWIFLLPITSTLISYSYSLS